MDKEETLLGLFKRRATPVSHDHGEVAMGKKQDRGIYGSTLQAITSLFTILLAVVIAFCEAVYQAFTTFGYRLSFHLNKEKNRE